MWTLSVPWWELVLRSLVVYGFLLLMLRATGKRQVGQLAPFDLILLLVLSNAVQNSMNAGDNSLLGGLISGGTLVLANFVVGLMTDRSRDLEILLEGRPIVLVHNGRVNERALRDANLSHHDLNAALRRQGVASVGEVHVAMFETNGAVSVVKRQEG
ncbi:MAG: DUF421 domain-containing protein [Gemmatimonadales bacterium]